MSSLPIDPSKLPSCLLSVFGCGYPSEPRFPRFDPLSMSGGGLKYVRPNADNIKPAAVAILRVPLYFDQGRYVANLLEYNTSSLQFEPGLLICRRAQRSTIPTTMANVTPYSRECTLTMRLQPQTHGHTVLLVEDLFGSDCDVRGCKPRKRRWN